MVDEIGGVLGVLYTPLYQTPINNSTTRSAWREGGVLQSKVITALGAYSLGEGA